MTTVTVGENQLQRIIRDLQDAVTELKREHAELGEPITDDSVSLHKFSYKLEYLLQFDQKEKKTLLGTRKDYWDYFSDCLGKIRGANDGIRYVKTIPELKTSLGKGRAFIRYSLVHKRLADTLQQCLMNQRVTSDWYYARSPFLKSHLAADIVNHLYELNEVQFDVASRGYDLDSSWPIFARRMLGSSAHMWRPPSRSSSVSSLVSNYSQAPEFLFSPEPGQSLLEDLSGLTSCSAVDELRVELDQSELRQQELLEQVEQLREEAVGLRGLVKSLEAQLEARPHQGALQAELVARQDLEARLSNAERRNTELLAKLDATLAKKGQQAAGHLDYAQKIHALLDKLSEAEKAKLEALGEAEWRQGEADALDEKLRLGEAAAAGGQYNPVTAGQVEELRGTIDKLQGVLVAKEEESSNLQMQLLDLRSSLEVRDQQVEELERRMQEGKKELEGRLRTLTEQATAKEDDLFVTTEKVQLLEKETEKRGLNAGLVEMEAVVKEQGLKEEDYKARCTSLMELNARMLQMLRKNEETQGELMEAQATLAAELSTPCGQGHEADTTAAVDRDCQEGLVGKLQQENLELREEQGILKGALLSTQEELCYLASQISELERSLHTSRRSEASLQEQLSDTVTLLESTKQWCEGLEASLQRMEKGSFGLASQTQLELHAREVSRLQNEAVDLCCDLHDVAKTAQLEVTEASPVELQALTEELKAQLEVTEASPVELQALTEELKAQVEELNLGHVQEIVRHQQREETLEREAESWSQESTFHREELSVLKQRLEQLALEQTEAVERLERAEAESAELGDRVRSLTAEKEEACARVRALEQENAGLREELQQAAALSATLLELQERLKQAEEQAKEEMDTIRFQMSSEALALQSKLQSANEDLEDVRQRHAAEVEKSRGLETRLSQLEDEMGRYSQLLDERSILTEKSESLICQKDAEIAKLTENLARAKEELSVTQVACRDLRRQIDLAAADRHSCDMKMAAEIDDLHRTKKNLEERLIELIRDKDALWQKSDALEFQQKLRSEELSDRDVTHCPGCQAQFSWWVRRHPCRLCGRTFCYYCSNSAIRMAPGGRRDRCCRDCESAQVRPLEANVGSSPSSHSSRYRPTHDVTVTEQITNLDDAMFDVITEEELTRVHDGESPSHMTGGSPEGTRATFLWETLDLGSSMGDTTPDDTDQLTPAVQDAEISLLKSGELTLLVPFSLEEVTSFGESFRELFIKSSCYSAIPITVTEAGPTISWVFSSEPKSISFSVVHREALGSTLELSKVLIPLTRCNSHKETIQGQLKVRNPGIYTLIFDNSFSRFISKKVLYHLSVEKPETDNGSELS